MGRQPATQAVHVQHLQIGNRAAQVFVGGTGPRTLLLLHGGWGGAAMHWSRVWNDLGAHFRIVAPDLPGLGDMTQPGAASIADYVVWLNQVLDALGIFRVCCVGNSFGASLAWSFAGRSPDRCTGLVLVDGFAVPKTPLPLRWLGRRALGRALMRRIVRQVSFTPKLLPRGFADPSRAPDELRVTLFDVPARQLETFVDCMIAGDGPPTPLAPILVLWGEADRLPGTRLEVGRKLAGKLRGAQFVAVPDAGHFPQVERPEAFAAALRQFAAPDADASSHLKTAV